ncbi:MAG TPA: tRNA adenosine(34) deaminase TadA [Blastocatellia bacterium]|nr:tRNA adenosine(34) deaminase TadA [Blastocatellia bacterium]
MEPADEDFMREALAEAEAAGEDGEVPVGAIVVLEGQLIGRGRNAVIGTNDPSAHAEIVALREAARAIGNYRLTGSTLYSTIEPCAMCAGALVHARVARLVYGAKDPKAGAVESHLGICTTDFLNHRVSVEGGLLESDCRRMLQSFFRERRNTQGLAERCESG